MVRFMEDAGSQTEFYRLAAEELAALLPPDSTVCDVGCGLGFSSLELARRFRSVRAIDLSPEVLAVLRKNNRYENLEIVEGDAFSMMPVVPYDGMLFCCCGQVHEIVEAARSQCTGAVLVIQKDSSHHRLTAGKPRSQRATFHLMEEEFAQLGIPFQSKRITVEMGQPLRSTEDGVRFLRAYYKGEDVSHITPQYVLERVVSREDPLFPYYIPMKTVMGFLSFRVQDIPR